MSRKNIAWLAWLWFGSMLILGLVSFKDSLVNQNVRGNFWDEIDLVFTLLISIAFPLVGALIISRKPQNTIGWLLMVPSLGIILDPLIKSQFAGVTVPPAHPAVFFWIALYFCNIIWVFVVFPIFLIALLFPTGKPISSRWWWVVAFALFQFVFIFSIATLDKTLTPDHQLYGLNWSIPNPIGIFDTTNDNIFTIWFFGVVVLAILCLVSVILRYRRADRIEREQIKWLLYAVGLFVTFYALYFMFQSSGLDFLGVFNSIFMLLIPISIGIAILRYRLWNIDLIIRKTLQYILLTGLLALVYSGSVILLQTLTDNLVGNQSQLVIVLSTLIIAALFNPLRLRLQNFIDRRFYRQKYDAQKILAQFAQTAREEVEIDVLQAELLRAVQETIQPESVNLLLKKIDMRTPHEI